MFCDDELLVRMSSTQSGRPITAALRKLHHRDEAVFRDALAIVHRVLGEDAANDFHTAYTALPKSAASAVASMNMNNIVNNSTLEAREA